MKLLGFTVGEVEDTSFHVNAGTAAITSSVTLELYAPLLHLAAEPDPVSAEALRAAIASLVAKGLHAELHRDPPLIGSYAVALRMAPDAGSPRHAAENALPEIPAMPAGGVDSLLTRLGNVPVDRIADRVLSITHHVDQIASSPALKDSVVQLHAALKEVHAVVANAGPQITTLVDSLRRTGSQLERTATEVQGLAQSAGGLVGGPTAQAGLQTAIREVTDAARSVRELADYLDQHPEALVHGR